MIISDIKIFKQTSKCKLDSDHCFDLSGLISAVGVTDGCSRQYMPEKDFCLPMKKWGHGRHHVCAYSLENLVNDSAKVTICDTNAKR